MILRLIKILKLYISLSGHGKRLFRRLFSMLNDARSLPHYRKLLATINGTMSADAARWFSCIRVSDAAFKEFIPAWYITQSKIKPEKLYYRFFKIAAILLYEHLSLFAAFNITVDTQAQKRGVLLSFLKRVYDDLLDNENMNKEILFNSQSSQESLGNADYRLFLELRKKVREVALPAEFNNYYTTLEQVHDAQGVMSGDEKNIPYSVKNGFLLDMYIIKNDLPRQLLLALEITSELFAYIDDFYDYDEDLAKGKLTRINQNPDPESALKEKFQETAAYLRAHSPNPDAYLKGVDNLMQNVLFARGHKLNKLSSFI